MYIIGNDSCYFMQLDILEPKVPEDIYKSHLEPNSEWCIYVGHISVQACHIARILLLLYDSADHFQLNYTEHVWAWFLQSSDTLLFIN